MRTVYFTNELVEECCSKTFMLFFALLMCTIPVRQTGLVAKPVEINLSDNGKKITLFVEGTHISTVLEALGNRFGFKFSDNRKNKTSEKLEITVSGNLDTVLQKLLRNQNYILSRSSRIKNGIAHVILIDRNPAPKFTPPVRSIKKYHPKPTKTDKSKKKSKSGSVSTQK